MRKNKFAAQLNSANSNSVISNSQLFSLDLPLGHLLLAIFWEARWPHG